MKNMQKCSQNDSQFPHAGPAAVREPVDHQQVALDPVKGRTGEGPEVASRQ